MFKVGDKVRRTGNTSSFDAPVDNVEHGEIYEVCRVSAGGAWLGLKGLKTGADKYPFSAGMFTLVKPELTKEQSAGVAGGLQEHSVGEYYPLAVVTYANGDNTVHFVENVQDGTVLCCHLSPSVFHTVDVALKAIEALSTDKPTLYSVSWVKGRPFRLPNVGWVVYTETNPVRVVRLKNMLHHNTNSSGS